MPVPQSHRIQTHSHSLQMPEGAAGQHCPLDLKGPESQVEAQGTAPACKVLYAAQLAEGHPWRELLLDDKALQEGEGQAGKAYSAQVCINGALGGVQQLQTVPAAAGELRRSGGQQAALPQEEHLQLRRNTRPRLQGNRYVCQLKEA